MREVPQGEVVYDETWEWGFTYYSATQYRNVDWIVGGHDVYSYPKGSTTLLSKEVLGITQYDTRKQTSGSRSDTANAINPFLYGAKAKFGSKFQNNMVYTNFKDVASGGASYTDGKYLFTPRTNRSGWWNNRFLQNGNKLGGYFRLTVKGKQKWEPITLSIGHVHLIVDHRVDNLY